LLLHLGDLLLLSLFIVLLLLLLGAERRPGLILVAPAKISIVALLACWNAAYFALLYKSDEVATGNDGIGYVTVTAKQQVVFSLWIAAVTCAFFAYYLCVLSHYKELYRKQQVTDWLTKHGKDADLGWSHEDETWPPLSAKEQKKKDDEEADKKMLTKWRKDKKKKEKEAEAKKDEGAEEGEEAKEGAE
jgi:hypothetical protein